MPSGGAAQGTILYAVTIGLSAGLLFLIQPIVARQLLPLLGGAAAVWGACMVCFQCFLLAGYFYAHWSVRKLSTRSQAILHLFLLTVSVVALFGSAKSATASSGLIVRYPAYECLRLLSILIGLPYFLLSSTTPLLQSWYSRVGRTALPYRLFALSNLASLLALLAYPLVLEPTLELNSQLAAWRAGYTAFAIVCSLVAVRTARLRVAYTAESQTGGAFRPVWALCSTWMFLAACASALLLSVTNILTQDIAPVPLLWILPLAAYLASFIVCFDREGLYKSSVSRVMVLPCLVGLLWVEAHPGINAKFAIPFCVLALFALCIFCHGQLAALKPDREGLTQFYLSLSVGGALGGMFVGLAAPALFSDLFEFRVAISAALVLALRYLFGYRSKPFLVTCAAVALVCLRAFDSGLDEGSKIYRGRNFYGTLAVNEVSGRAGGAVRTLLHGRTVHGSQFVSGRMSMEPTAYYGRESGAGLALQRPKPGHRVGIVGLGAGTLAAYGHEGDYYRFYEINPLVIDLARSYFTYLHDTRASVDVVLGDARRSLESEPNQEFDTLVLDAFSGDSVPVHLLTREAFQCYFRHVKPDGVIAVHVSNTYLDLSRVVEGVTSSFGRESALVRSAGNTDRLVSAADWILVGDDLRWVKGDYPIRRIDVRRTGPDRVWTDQYSNLLKVLK